MGVVDLMPVVVRNESAKDFRISVRGNGRPAQTIPVGGTVALSDDEFESIPFGKRGPGQINPVSDENVQQQTKLDYYVVNGGFQTRYVGQAAPGVAESDPSWTVRRFSHVALGPSDARVEHIEFREGIAWSDRNTGW